MMQMQRCSVQAGAVRAASTRRAAAVSVRAKAAAVSANAKVVVKEHGSVTLRGTVRKVNEDRFDVKVSSRWEVMAETVVLWLTVQWLSWFLGSKQTLRDCGCG